MQLLVLLLLLLLLSCSAFPLTAHAQNSSLLHRDLPTGPAPPPTLGDYSWILTPGVVPKELRVHDIVSIRVQEGAQMLAEGQVERRRNMLYNAALLDWVRFDKNLNLRPAPQTEGDLRLKGQLDQLYRADSEVETRESLTFNIAAHIVDIRPNGTLVLEAHRQIKNNHEVWEYSLSGICRKEDIGPGNVVLSRDIAELKVDKRECGNVRDGYRRGWFVKLLDQLSPF